MTFDAASRLGVPTAPERATNTRTPSLDLDSVYGGGPDTQSAALRSERPGQVQGRTRRRVRGSAAVGQRNRAIIADPRNDENMMISGLQVAFLLFHNRVVDTILRGRNLGGQSTDAAAEGLISMPRRDTRGATSSAASSPRPAAWSPGTISGSSSTSSCRRSSAPRWSRDILTRGRRFYTPRRGRAEHPRGVSRRGLPLRPQHGPAVVSRQPGWRRRHSRSSASSSTRPGRGRPIRSICAAERGRAAPLHRLADLLRLRRRPDHQRASAES